MSTLRLPLAKPNWLRFLATSLLAFASFFTNADARTNPSYGSIIIAWDANPEPDIAGYKVYYGTSSRDYFEPIDVGPTTQAEIPNLLSGETYYIALTAYNTVGLESEFSAEAVITYIKGDPELQPGEGRLVLLEAEEGTLTSPMVVDSDASQVSWVESSALSQEGSVSLDFDAPIDSEYYVWCRVFAPTIGTDSYFVSADGAPEFEFHVHGGPTPPPEDVVAEWVWRRILVDDGSPMDFGLTAGSHSLNFRTRETGARLDRVVLATSPNFVPTDDLPRSGEVVTVVRGPYSVSASAGSSVTLDVEVLGTGPIEFQWVKDGTAVSGANGSTLTVDSADEEDRGNYSVFVFSGETTILSSPAFLEIVASDLRVSRMTLAAGNQLTFDVSGGGGSSSGGVAETVEVYASNVLSDWSDPANSADWQLIGTQEVSAGKVVIEDPGADGETRRFYVLKTP